MSRILQERKNVHFIIKTSGFNDLCRLPNTTWITEWLSDPDLVSLYDSCDILLAPSRGGGFEINVLEGLARGLIVITSDWSAIQEYAGPYVLTVKSTEEKINILPGNPIHIGYGANPDANHLYEILNYAIENLDYLKKKAEKNAPIIREKYNWKNTARRIAECLE